MMVPGDSNIRNSRKRIYHARSSHLRYDSLKNAKDAKKQIE